MNEKEPLAGLARHLEEARCREAEDAVRFAALDWDVCQLCGAEGEDKRSLWIDCMYAVCEVVPEAIGLGAVQPPPERGRGFVCNLCKSCRGRLLDHLGAWRQECVARRHVPKDHDGHPLDREEGRDIPTRVNGHLVWLTREEWYAQQPGREPVVWKEEAP